MQNNVVYHLVLQHIVIVIGYVIYVQLMFQHLLVCKNLQHQNIVGEQDQVLMDTQEFMD